MISSLQGLDTSFSDPNAMDLRKAGVCAEFLRSLDGLEEINLFAACFCEDRDLLSQWHGYTGGSHGFSVGFDVNALRQATATAGFVFGRCIYDAAVQQTIVEQAIDHCLADELAIPPQSQWGGHGPLAAILFRYGVFFKDPSFAEEKEWRLVSPTVTFRCKRLAFRSGRSMITPYYKLPICHDGVPPVSHVIVGPCPHMDLSKSAVTALLMRAGIRGPQEGRQVAFASKIPFRDW